MSQVRDGGEARGQPVLDVRSQPNGHRVPPARRAVTIGNEAAPTGLASKVPDGPAPSLSPDGALTPSLAPGRPTLLVSFVCPGNCFWPSDVLDRIHCPADAHQRESDQAAGSGLWRIAAWPDMAAA